jgi:DNA-binding CsgD family transcriptional regulator
VIVGRQNELVAVERLFDASVDAVNACVLDGEAGIGRTALWTEAVRIATDRSWNVMTASAAQSEVTLTYVGLGDLFADVPDVMFEGLPPPQRRALAVALLHAEPGEGPLAQRAVAAGFLAVLTALAETGPVLVAVDDVQWLDAASAALLGFAARRLRSLPVRLLLSIRTGGPEPFPLQLTLGPRMARVAIGPLNSAALHQLIKARTGSRLTRRRLAQIERLSGGNALFALELARQLAAHDDVEETPPLPATLADALLARVRALPQPTRAALLTLAVSAQPNTRLVDAEALAVAEEASIVRTCPRGAVSFEHPLLRWVVRSDASTRQRQAAHVRLAGQAENADERARHRALAATGRDPDLARELEQFASLARARGAPAAAADLLFHARRLTPEHDHASWASRCAQEVSLLLEAGDWEQAWQLGQQALATLPPGPGRATVLIAAAEHRPGAEDLCQQALAESGGDPAIDIRAQLSLGVQRLYQFDTSAVHRHIDAAVELARQLGDPTLLCVALTHASFAAVLLPGGGDPTAALDEALQLEGELAARPLPIAMSASCYQAIWRMCVEELEPARSELERLLDLAVAWGDEGSQAQILSFLGILETRAGNWARARQLLQASLELAELMEFSQGAAEKRGWLALLQAQQGELDAARSNTTQGLQTSSAIGDKIGIVVHHAALAHVALSGDDPATVLDHTRQIRETFPTGLDPPIWLDFEGDELDALISRGNTSDAEQLVDSLTRRVRRHPRPTWNTWIVRATTVLAASEGNLAAVDTLNRLLDDNDLAAPPFEIARTLLAKGQIERRAKHKAAARDALQQAAQTFQQLGATVWAQKARGDIERLGLRHGRDELTETERRVAHLAAAGKTNREIAAELFISRRTVETNIARAYTKLGVTNRAALATQLAGQPAGPLNA